MIRYRKKYQAQTIFVLFVVGMFCAIMLFILRVMNDSGVTPFTSGQVIMLSEDSHILPGSVYDRNMETILEGSPDGIKWANSAIKASFEEVLGIDVGSTYNSATTIIGNCPWLFGTETNNLTVEGLLHPNLEKTGGSVQLTIDRTLQDYAYTLASECGYEDIYIVVSNYKTGELLCLIGDVFKSGLHPGSTIKPIIAAAALEVDPSKEKLIYECIPENHIFNVEECKQQIDCFNGYYHGTMTMNDAIAYSCNGYFVHLLETCEMDKILTELKKFGFDTEIAYNQFSFWDHTFLGKQSENVELDYLLGAIGQANVTITPFGMNTCSQALLNHGKLVEPKVLQKKKSSQQDEWELLVTPDNNYSFCSKKVADKVCSMMEGVCEYGTGTDFALDGFAAKTGTAQKGINDNNGEELYSVWVTGGLTNENSPYAITICIDNVTDNVHSYDAGMIAQNILWYLLGGENYE